MTWEFETVSLWAPPPQSVTWGNVEPWEVCQIWIWANLDLGALVRSLILPLSGYTYVSSSLWPGVLPLTMILIGLPPWLVQLPFKILVKVWFYFFIVLCFGFVKTESHFTAQAVSRLTMEPRLAMNLQPFFCLSLLGAGIMGMSCHVQKWGHDMMRVGTCMCLMWRLSTGLL